MDTTTHSVTNPQSPSSVECRKTKLTAMLDRQRTVVMTGVDSTMEDYLLAVGELLKRAVAARKQGVQLPTFLAMLRDQANR